MCLCITHCCGLWQSQQLVSFCSTLGKGAGARGDKADFPTDKTTHDVLSSCIFDGPLGVNGTM